MKDLANRIVAVTGRTGEPDAGRRSLVRMGLAGIAGTAAAGLAACGSTRDATSRMVRDAGVDTSTQWRHLLRNGEGLNNFRRLGDANWTRDADTITATQGGTEPSYLVSYDSFENFELHVEFWVSDDANTGVFLRCQQPQNVSSQTAYEVNVFDQRPDPSFGTGAIVDVARASTPQKAGGRWNTLDIKANGPQLAVELNGQPTAQGSDRRFLSGPIALQWGKGQVRFRAVAIRRLQG